MTALAPLAGCAFTDGPTDPIQALPRELSAAETEAIASSNDFAFDLFRVLAAGEREENVLISPLSASMALGMAMNGARGETWDQMRDVLGYRTLEQPSINEAYHGLIELLPGLDPATETTIANSVWHDHGFVLEPDFVHTVRESFDAEVASLDFANPSAPDRINDWVAHATRQRIPSIIDDIPPLAVAYLVNAIYFKASWRERFDPAETRDDRFTTGAGARIDVRMMNRSGNLAVSTGPGFQMADLPYGNGAYSMTLLLPDQGTDLDTLVEALNPSVWRTALGQLSSRPATIALPRMSFEVQARLKSPLMAMGMTLPFMDGFADFSGMSRAGRQLYISDVVHKTRIEVDEDGTEAAAATGVEISVVSMPPTLRFDRPFILAIRESLSGTILFLGRVNRPV